MNNINNKKYIFLNICNIKIHTQGHEQCHTLDTIYYPKCKFASLIFVSSPLPLHFFESKSVSIFCHLQVGCHKEIYIVLKPSQHFATYE